MMRHLHEVQGLLQQGRVDLQRVQESGLCPEAGQPGHQQPRHSEAESALSHTTQHHAHPGHLILLEMIRRVSDDVCSVFRTQLQLSRLLQNHAEADLGRRCTQQQETSGNFRGTETHYVIGLEGESVRTRDIVFIFK